jgi:hypothetical protein
MYTYLCLTIALVCLLASASGRTSVTGLQRLEIKDAVTELEWFYNTNMDSGAALGSVRPHTDPEFLARVKNVVDTFCPDPIFKGWFASIGPNGTIVFQALHRDTPSVFPSPDGTFSVLTIYRDLLPGGLFRNSSEHMVGMPIADVYYDDVGVLRVDLNMTLAQWVTGGNPIATTLTMGHYYNRFRYIPVGNPTLKRDGAEASSTGRGYWCMEQFNEFGTFSFQLAQGTNVVSPQNYDNNQLSAFVRPPVDGSSSGL